MGLFTISLQVGYVLCVLILTLYTCGQLYLLYTYVRLCYLRSRQPSPIPVAPDTDKTPDAPLPRVTIQIPLFNERYVARRAIDAAAALDYPRDRLHIQVLDDSTDDTTDLVQNRVAQWCAEGLSIRVIHRHDRTGYKAGALAAGLAQTDSEFIAIFDADFVPPPDFLRRTVPCLLADERTGIVQTRWGHLNDGANLLTRSQALAIDGHFVIEQYTRDAANLLSNFNGSGGVWRRACILDAGGWQPDTLTEDFDLSFRAQIKGWRVAFLRDVVVPGEVPSQMTAYKQQQARWSKGSTQVLFRMAWPLLRSNLDLRQKLMGLVQMFQYAIQPVLLLTLLLTPWVIVTHALDGLPLAPLGILGFVLPLLYILYILSQHALYPDWWKRSLYFPALMLFSSGLIANNSRAVLSALLGRPGEFKRTPKTGESPQWTPDLMPEPDTYTAVTGSSTGWEIGLGLYALASALVARTFAPSFIPYFLIYALAFFGVAAGEITELWSMPHPIPQSHHSPADTKPAGQPGR